MGLRTDSVDHVAYPGDLCNGPRIASQTVEAGKRLESSACKRQRYGPVRYAADNVVILDPVFDSFNCCYLVFPSRRIRIELLNLYAPFSLSASAHKRYPC